ncbi:aminotransferase class V [Chlorella sorokiniana]|uniref:Aminotransferase class V n=1 Tax=Chlorella sorokiniana TaxID=3076 RepID=A0A2P6TXQ3_CHLSO|nr:aminotransferase class V [Chlorella sorokiniana]|eukprot:PRW58845.1 aminotransferase class V [Chlorella sorokiniana]
MEAGAQPHVQLVQQATNVGLNGRRAGRAASWTPARPFLVRSNRLGGASRWLLRLTGWPPLSRPPPCLCCSSGSSDHIPTLHSHCSMAAAADQAWTEADTAAARRAIPHLRPGLVHLNNAGCSIPMHATLAAVQDYLAREASDGGYEVFDASVDALRRPYTALATLLNCRPEEIAVLTSATAAWQQVLYGLAWGWRPGDRVLTSVHEYGSNAIALLQLAGRTGVSLEVIPETPDGDINTAALQRMLGSSPKPVLVAISHIPTSSGQVYDAAAVGALCRQAGVLYMLDACQSIGQLPVDVQAIQCDFACGTGRKYLRGPRGSGFLFCRSDALDKFEPAVLDNTGGSWSGSREYSIDPTAKRFESYEMAFAAKVGLGVAVEECVQLGIGRIWSRVQHLAQQLRQGLAALPGVTVQDRGRLLCGLVSFTVEGLTADELQQGLAARHINTSVSRIGSSRWDFEARQLEAVVRASVHCFNTEEELQRCVEAVGQLAAAAARGGQR